VVREYDTGQYAVSATAKATACLSTDVRSRRHSKSRTDGNARAPRRTLSIPADAVSRRIRPRVGPDNFRQYENNLWVRVRLRAIVFQ
jgi:hypothetical protein